MENCTQLELVLDNLGNKALVDLSRKLSAAQPWKEVRSLRMITGCSSVESNILEHMVPKLEALQFEDFKYGHTEKARIGRNPSSKAGLDDHTSGPGSVLLKAEKCHKKLKRLHIAVSTQNSVPQELFPPFHLFKRILGSFRELEWLGIDINHRGTGHPYPVLNPEDHIVSYYTHPLVWIFYKDAN